MSRSRRTSKNIDFLEWSDKCMTCGNMACVCARWPGFAIKKWEGPKKNYAFTPDQLLCAATREAVKPESPPDFMIAVLQYFAATE